MGKQVLRAGRVEEKPGGVAEQGVDLAVR